MKIQTALKNKPVIAADSCENMDGRDAYNTEVKGSPLELGQRNDSRNVDISAFFDGDGRVTRIPSPNRTKIPVLTYLSGKFEKDRFYTEKEINEIIDKWHTFNDYFILRRLLIDYKLLERTRDGSKYWLVNKEE